MEPITFIEGSCVPLPRSDVDTDQIIPSDWLKRVERTGFEKGLFSEWRDDPAFVLNNNLYDNATILVAGPNFGTGSSREHAVWALQQYGFKAVVSSRFGDIFRNNALKCGLLPVEVPEKFVAALFLEIEADPNTKVAIDIEKLEINTTETSNAEHLTSKFKLSPDAQEHLIKGLDDISLTFQLEDKIKAHESNRPAWLQINSK